MQCPARCRKDLYEYEYDVPDVNLGRGRACAATGSGVACSSYQTRRPSWSDTEDLPYEVISPHALPAALFG